MLTLYTMKWMAAAVAGLAGLAIAGSPTSRSPVPPGPILQRVEIASGEVLMVAFREVTRREWRACAEANACEDLTGVISSSEPDMPMTGISYIDVQTYLAWINAAGSQQYRLPTDSEWKDFASALPQKPYRKLFTDPRMSWAADYGSMKKVSGVVKTTGTFGTLPNGLSDLSGNVWEWTSTCAGAGIEPDRCPAFLVEGLHETALSVFIRDPASGGCAVGAPPANVGFRLVSDE